MNAVEMLPIAGERFAGADALTVFSPYDGAVVGRVAKATVAEVEIACRAAARALHDDNFPQHARVAALEAAALRVADDGERLAALICAEVGKPIATARTEVARCVECLRCSAQAARSLAGDMVPVAAAAAGAGKLAFTVREPIGVVAAITPFNFPLNLVAHKLGPALAAGCPVVLKPAPQAPLTALALVEHLFAAGVPRDWLSVLCDEDGALGAALVAHPVPAAISFTGSQKVGWAIRAQAPRKVVLLELGSTAPLLVAADADLDRLLDRLPAAAFGGCGQSCISTQRILVDHRRHDELVSGLVARAQALTCGDPADPATAVGPLIHQREVARVLAWIDEAVAAGAQVVCGGQAQADGVLPPTVVVGVDEGMRLWDEEVFAPVVAVRAVADLEEAVALANRGPAIHAGVFTRDIAAALAAVRALRFGGVLINEVPTWRAENQPYGGVAEAGNTREGPAATVAELTISKFVSIEG
ncbi:MAG: aldehyde dehydrogenase family protein [Planctomycetota bacterium]|jgi:acyl-CoA reductase-like NAD-dependent aldehyde dehydrogenase